MKKLIYDRNKLKDYKEFYERIYVDLEGAGMNDWETFDCLGYDGNRLYEFFWYCHQDNFHIVFKNFDLEKVKNFKNYEDYQWKLIFEVCCEKVKEFPNNKVEFINDEK